MGQRLGVAAALLGQPQTVVLDEPVNGLDPDGVRWIRLLLRLLAEEGRTVFLSSHLMSEMAQTAARLVILGRGKRAALDLVLRPDRGGADRRRWCPGRRGKGGKPYRVSAGHPAVTAVSVSLSRVLLAQLVLGVLGVSFSGEYGTGMIRATLAVVPPRLPVLWAKLAAQPLGPWAGFAVLCGYAVVLTGLAAWRLRRRDA